MLLAVGELCVGLRATLLFRLPLITDRFVGRIVELSNDYVINPLLRVLFQRLFDCKDLFLQRIYLVHYLHLGEFIGNLLHDLNLHLLQLFIDWLNLLTLDG